MNNIRDSDMTIPDYQASSLSGPARVGFELRGVRERLGWKLPDLAARLKIRLPFLEAIEAGDLAALPAPAYAAGFIRSYAETMGLDPDEILRRFRAEGLTRQKQPHLTFPEPVPDRAVPPGAVIFLVAVIGIGAYILWYRHSEHEIRMAQMVPSVPAKLAPLAVPRPVVPKAVVTKAVVPKPVAVSPATTPVAPPVTATAAPPALASATPSPASTTAPMVTATTTPPATAATASQGAATGAPASSAPAANPLVISATADSWVQVQGPHGTVLFSRVLKAGTTWPVPDEPGLTLTTGNAGGTVLIRNGVTGAALGGAGSVLRHVPLTPAVASPGPVTSTPTPQTAKAKP